MRMSVHLNFPGNCAEAFAFYQQVFGVDQAFAMKYSQAPQGMPVQEDWKEKIMHTSIPLGVGFLMGCDAPPGSAAPFGGFQVSVEIVDEAETRRIFTSLKDGGSVQMEMAPTFWSPLFGMCTDKFGIAWMVSVQGPDQP